MDSAEWAGKGSREIVSRIIVEADLELQTPAHFGNGDGDDLTDMPLLVDPSDGASPLLTGASLAGALRAYLRAREMADANASPQPGNQPASSPQPSSAALFGGSRSDDEGEQSPLIIDDALGKAGTFGIDRRDGVRIAPNSRTAEHDKLFNLEVWEAGTVFPLRFELLVRARNNGDDGNDLKCALATSLSGLTDGGVTLGARKRRGYGRIEVRTWHVTSFDLTTTDGILAWVAAGRTGLAAAPRTRTGDDISKLLEVTRLDDARHILSIRAAFSLDGSVLIRSGGGKDDRGPDMVHLHARQPGLKSRQQPVISGTSLGGALRARATRIVKTLLAAVPPADRAGAPERAAHLTDDLFGPEIRAGVKPRASRLTVEERPIAVPSQAPELVQNRVSIDRFTGGARETALFNQQPVFGGEDTTVAVNLDLADPKDHEIGLLLLLLKDLWTGDLPIGGESSVGRGRLKGRHAELTRRGGPTPAAWKVAAKGDGLTIDGDRGQLERFVAEHLPRYLREQRAPALAKEVSP